jgi:DNA-binding response OmpR family regulator
MPDAEKVKKPKVLVVDDDPTARLIISRILLKGDYEVKEATDGFDGFEMAKAFQPDVMIVDWLMPGVDGEQLTKLIKSDPTLRFIYVIILTSKGEAEDRVRGLQAGADDYISKPMPNEEVLARVESGMRMRALYKELEQLTKRLAVLEIAATVGHEINNPLNVIYLALDMMRKYIKLKEYDKLEKGIDLIAETADRLRMISRKFVELKDPRSTKYVNHVNMIDLRDDKEKKPQ